MAARKHNQQRFYVYLIEDGSNAHYVGKGSGSRLRVQQRRYGLPGRILERFISERAAFAAERKWIALLKPCENRCPGGNGGTVRIPALRKPNWVSKIEQMGTRVYAARILLDVYRVAPHMAEPSKVDVIRQVAYGCRA